MKEITKNLNVVVFGHVDSGKSTTVGHLLYKLGVIDNSVIEEKVKEPFEIERQGLKFSWVF